MTPQELPPGDIPPSHQPLQPTDFRAQRPLLPHSCFLFSSLTLTDTQGTGDQAPGFSIWAPQPCQASGPGTRALLFTQNPPRAGGHVHLLFLHCLHSPPHTHLVHPGSRGSPFLTAPAPHLGGALPASPAMSPIRSAGHGLSLNSTHCGFGLHLPVSGSAFVSNDIPLL